MTEGRAWGQSDAASLAAWKTAVMPASVLRSALAAALLLVALPASAAATAPSTRYVATAGSDAGSCTAAAPCRTIQHAIDVAGGGDTISIGAGTFVEQVTVTDRDLTIAGAGAATVLQAPDAPLATTFLAGGSPVQAVLGIVDADVAIRDLTVTGAGRVQGASYVNAGLTGVALEDSGADIDRIAVRDVRGRIGGAAAGTGVLAHGSDLLVRPLAISGTAIRGNGVGFRNAAPGSATSIHESVILDNDTNVANDTLDTIDARENWWGIHYPNDVPSFGTSSVLLSQVEVPERLERDQVADVRITIRRRDGSVATNLPPIVASVTGRYGSTVDDTTVTLIGGEGHTKLRPGRYGGSASVEITIDGDIHDEQVAFVDVPGPVNITRPAVAGTLRYKQQLTCTPGRWDGTVTRVETELRRDGVLVGSGGRMTLGVDEAFSRIRCVEHAYNARGGVTEAASDIVTLPGFTTVRPADGTTAAGFAIDARGRVKVRFACNGGAPCDFTATVTKRATFLETMSSPTPTKADLRQRPFAKTARVQIAAMTSAKDGTKDVTLRFGSAFVKKIQKTGVRRYAVAINVASTSPYGFEPKQSFRTTLLVPKAKKAKKATKAKKSKKSKQQHR